MIAIRRIDHVCLRVADVDEASRRWAMQFGLTERGAGRHRAFLRCGYEPYSLELVGAGATRPRPHRVGAAPQLPLDDAAAHLRRTTVSTTSDQTATCPSPTRRGPASS